MQLDTEDGETFIPPAGIVASPTNETSSSPAERPETRDSEDAALGATSEASGEQEE